MGPVKQREVKRLSTKSLKSKAKSKAQLASMKRWASQASKVCEPIPGPSGEPMTTCSPNDAQLMNYLLHKSGSSEIQVDKYTNIRKTELNHSDIKIDQEVGLTKEAAPEYLLVDINSLKTLVEKCACPDCLESELVLVTKNRVGFNSYLSLECGACKRETVCVSSSKKIADDAGFDVNRRITKAFLNMSKGHSAVEQFSLIMNMSHMSKGLFHKNCTTLHKLSTVTSDEYLAKARKRVRDFCKEQDQSVTDTSVIDLAVSYDGSWHKRGFTSNYGVGSVIHIDTGLVIDFCTLSKFCRNCALTKEQLGEDSPEFSIWFQGHAKECEKNYSGSSPAMEVAAAEILWKRSIEYNFRYTTVVSDGDSKVFSHLKQLNVYGTDVLIEKEECINHVSKRLGTALRNLVKDTRKTDKVTLGGKTFGGLTDRTITKLTRYYHNAISENINKDVASMKTSILGTLYHCISTDQYPKHFNCPQGEHSWCFYNRALANNETPGKHSEHIKTPINNTVLKYMIPVYKRLTDRELLRKCLKGQTQNSNESLHSNIWRKCDKARSVSKRLVEIAVADAISEYNFGNVATISSLINASLSPGSKTSSLAKIRDRRRQIKVEKAKCARLKRRRHYLKIKNIQEEEKRKEIEGVTYGPGQF